MDTSHSNETVEKDEPSKTIADAHMNMSHVNPTSCTEFEAYDPENPFNLHKTDLQVVNNLYDTMFASENAKDTNDTTLVINDDFSYDGENKKPKKRTVNEETPTETDQSMHESYAKPLRANTSNKHAHAVDA